MKVLDKILEAFKDIREGEIFSRKDIIDIVVDYFPDTKRTSVIPSDYFYNITNMGIKFSKHDRLFENLGAEYRYLGLYANYNGKIYWKGRAVGEWQDGEFKFWEYVGK